MRELVSSFQLGKPIIPLIDPDASRGGLSQEEVRERLHEAEGSYLKWGFDAGTTPRAAELYAHLFAREPIEWNRIGCFQDVTMRLIAERLLPPQLHGATTDVRYVKPYRGRAATPTIVWSCPHRARASLSTSAAARTTTGMNELGESLGLKLHVTERMCGSRTLRRASGGQKCLRILVKANF